MPAFDFSTIATWIYELFVYHIFGDALLAGMFGFIMLLVIGVVLKLSIDGFVVLGVFGGILFSWFYLPTDITMVFLIGIGVIAAMAMIRLWRR